MSPSAEDPPIMVVEDDPNILRQIEFNLRSHGYSVVTAISGADALRQMLLLRPSLLVTDIMMPEMDGYELVATLRKDRDLADLPVMVEDCPLARSAMAKAVAAAPPSSGLRRTWASSSPSTSNFPAV